MEVTSGWSWSFSSGWDWLLIAVYLAGVACDAMGLWLLREAFRRSAALVRFVASGRPLEPIGDDDCSDSQRELHAVRTKLEGDIAELRHDLAVERSLREGLKKRLEHIEQHLQQPVSERRTRWGSCLVLAGVVLGSLGNVLSLVVGS